MQEKNTNVPGEKKQPEWPQAGKLGGQGGQGEVGKQGGQGDLGKQGDQGGDSVKSGDTGKQGHE